MLWNASAMGLRDFHIKVLEEYTIPTELRIYMIHIRKDTQLIQLSYKTTLIK